VTVRLRQTAEADLAFVCALERDPETAPWVLAWSEERHRAAIADPDEEHLLLVAGEEDGERALGFVLLAGLCDANNCVQLRRIVVAERGRGSGRAGLELIQEHAFAELGARRLWLDLQVRNLRARRASAAVGFLPEGILRDAMKTADGYVSLAVMSMLAPEWRTRLWAGDGP
jgi:diamine N-acetyltransferase